MSSQNRPADASAETSDLHLALWRGSLSTHHGACRRRGGRLRVALPGPWVGDGDVRGVHNFVAQTAEGLPTVAMTR
jgi:hypothetical protein